LDHYRYYYSIVYLAFKSMNKLIGQLAEQAEKYADDNFKGEIFWTEAYESKFAELIVKECISVAVDNGCGDFVDIEHLLLKHFGVES
jgi:hypothetical protein